MGPWTSDTLMSLATYRLDGRFYMFVDSATLLIPPAQVFFR